MDLFQGDAAAKPDVNHKEGSPETKKFAKYKEQLKQQSSRGMGVGSGKIAVDCDYGDEGRVQVTGVDLERVCPCSRNR